MKWAFGTHTHREEKPNRWNISNNLFDLINAFIKIFIRSTKNINAYKWEITYFNGTYFENNIYIY